MGKRKRKKSCVEVDYCDKRRPESDASKDKYLVSVQTDALDVKVEERAEEIIQVVSKTFRKDNQEKLVNIEGFCWAIEKAIGIAEAIKRKALSKSAQISKLTILQTTNIANKDDKPHIQIILSFKQINDEKV